MAAGSAPRTLLACTRRQLLTGARIPRLPAKARLPPLSYASRSVSSTGAEDGRTRSAGEASSGRDVSRRRNLVDEMLRVDQAGELGAVQIYSGQQWILRGSDLEETLKHMKDGEAVHLRTINRLMSTRRVRPTALLPLWEAAGFALGVATALLGKRAAMACTVAVETSIAEHYNDQIRRLLADGHKDPELLAVLVQHRDEELEHHDKAKSLGAEQAPLYGAITTVIQAGCAVAIQVAKRV